VRRLTLFSLAAATIVGIAIGVLLHGRLESSPAAAKPALPQLHGEATWAAGRRPAPAFALADQRGRLVSLRSLRGRTVLLTFQDSLCKQACPVEGRMVAAALRQVPAARRPHVVVVSVDPAGDTPKTVSAALRKWQLGDRVSWLLGSRAQLRPVWRAYQITVLPVAGDIVHSTAIYVIDRNGDERAGFLLPFEPALLADDLRELGS
jgi:protein SCO1/2